jgi:hypothetical protein
MSDSIYPMTDAITEAVVAQLRTRAITEAVVVQLRTRAEKGKEKYGTTMERDDLTLMQWLQHLQEELMDAAVYVEKLKGEIGEK